MTGLRKSYAAGCPVQSSLVRRSQNFPEPESPRSKTLRCRGAPTSATRGLARGRLATRKKNPANTSPKVRLESTAPSLPAEALVCRHWVFAGHNRILARRRLGGIDADGLDPSSHQLIQCFGGMLIRLSQFLVVKLRTMPVDVRNVLEHQEAAVLRGDSFASNRWDYCEFPAFGVHPADSFRPAVFGSSGA